MYVDIQLQQNVEYLKVFEIQETWPKSYLKNFSNHVAMWQHYSRIKVEMCRQIPKHTKYCSAENLAMSGKFGPIMQRPGIIYLLNVWRK